jgi:hypothetical protein
MPCPPYPAGIASNIWQEADPGESTRGIFLHRPGAGRFADGGDELTITWYVRWLPPPCSDCRPVRRLFLNGLLARHN